MEVTIYVKVTMLINFFCNCICIKLYLNEFDRTVKSVNVLSFSFCCLHLKCCFSLQSISKDILITKG